MSGSYQPSMVPGEIHYKRKYTLWVLILLVIVCWPAAIVYWFTREKVPVQEFKTYAAPMGGYQQVPPAGGASPAAGGPPGPPPASTASVAATGGPPAPAAPMCPTCGRPTTFVPQYNRYYCYNCSKYV